MAVRTDRRRPVQGPARIAQYQLLVEEGVDLFSRHDRSGRFLDASPAAAQVLGHTPTELIGRRWHDLVHWDDRARFDGWWHNLHGGSGTILAFRIHRSDGSVSRLETAARAGVLLDDQVFEVQAITRAAPSALESAESLARRCHEAEERASHLDRVNRDLSRFAADTAHDLRSPLQVIAGFAQLMVRRDAHRLDEDSQRGLAIIMAAVNDMAEMIDSALAQASPEVGERRPGPVDCTEAARRAVQRVKTQIEAAGAVVEVGDLPVVHGEPIQLGRVFQNLLSNAVKAAAPGRTPRVDISARRIADGWEISVTDNGIGVSPEDRERIFEMFTHAWGDDRTEGSGIGLAICQSIVERHGGRIWVEPAPDGGSRFSFVLPG
jgi:PAS domain S-box-containing protein